ARIVRSYSSRTFGFASRNFYVSFLAALDIDRNPEKYFGALQKQSEARFQEVQMPAYVPMATLERALKIDADKLRALNPALLRSVWDGQQRVPKAYHLRLPLDGSGWTRELLAQRLSPAEMFAGQSSPPRYRVQRGDTLTSVAVRYGVSAETLARLNHLRTGAQLHAGRRITVPESPPRPRRRAPPRPARNRGRRQGRRRSARRSVQRRRPSRTPIRTTTASRTTTRSGWPGTRPWGITPTGSA